MLGLWYTNWIEDPLELYKTRQQLYQQPKAHGSIARAPAPAIGSAMFRGTSAYVTGNCSKALVRFSVYNWATKFMSDPNGQVSAPQVVVAGMFTGLCESLVVVPFESIKVTMIERGMVNENYKPGELMLGMSKRLNAGRKNSSKVDTATEKQNAVQEKTKEAKPKPKATIRPPAPATPIVTSKRLRPIDPNVHGLFANMRNMYDERGLRAFVQGFMPTMWRQIFNSVVRFASYNFMKQTIFPSGEDMPPAYSLGLGMAAGAIEVLATQPIDVVKSRMQSSNGPIIYGNSLICSYRIFADEGPLRLWSGMLPRFIKVSFSGGLIFTVYEVTNSLVTRAMSENPFSAE